MLLLHDGVRGAPRKNIRVYLGIVQICTFGHFVHVFFTGNKKILKTVIMGDYGKKLFWYGILMEIMVNIDQIWWKLGASAMVYIH